MVVRLTPKRPAALRYLVGLVLAATCPPAPTGRGFPVRVSLVAPEPLRVSIPVAGVAGVVLSVVMPLRLSVVPVVPEQVRVSRVARLHALVAGVAERDQEVRLVLVVPVVVARVEQQVQEPLDLRTQVAVVEVRESVLLVVALAALAS